MDLRDKLTPQQLQVGLELIKSGHLFYQPFILHEDLEVGEAQNFCDGYKDVDSVHDLNVYAKGFELGARKLAKDKEYFRQCNAEYRAFYQFMADNIKKCSGKNFNELSFAEIGCNTGLMLFELAARGAKTCVGYDWNDMNPVFNWLNGVLKTNVNFMQGTWNNLYHHFTACDIPEADVMINTIYTNHQSDPLPFLAYICDRARVGVMLWLLIADTNDCSVQYPETPVHKILENNCPFPLNLNNDIRISKKMLYSALKQLGFGDVIEINPREAVKNPKWEPFLGTFKMLYVRRTSQARSAYWDKKITKDTDDAIAPLIQLCQR